MVRISCRGDCEELTAASGYLLYDADKPPPTKEMRDVINYCYSRKEQLIIGCDVNAHHILLGSTCTNPRGKALTKYLVSANLNILNQGNEPTFMVYTRHK
jgi:hypothetical protein